MRWIRFAVGPRSFAPVLVFQGGGHLYVILEQDVIARPRGDHQGYRDQGSLSRAHSVFVVVERVQKVLELPLPGSEDQIMAELEELVVRPIGVVHSPRTGLEDDYWGSVVSTIEVDGGQFTEQAVLGLESFSHLEVIYSFHKVAPEKVVKDARHPRGEAHLPKLGIFAQRAKARPNRLGLSCCELLRREGLRLTVRGLDAIDGTPVLDLKPYMAEFAPRGQVRQPAWTAEIMAHYFDTESPAK